MKPALSKRMAEWLKQPGFGDRLTEALIKRESRFEFNGHIYRVRRIGAAPRKDNDK